MSIPRTRWRQRGLAGHLCVSDKCRFHLCTDIGKYRVSTVGAYYPTEQTKQMEDIGWKRHYETMVFELGADGSPLSMSEVDMDGVEHKPKDDPYETDRKAEAMHERMCIRWAKNQRGKNPQV